MSKRVNVCVWFPVGKAMQEEFSHMALHRNRAAASQAAKTRAAAAGNTAHTQTQH